MTKSENILITKASGQKAPFNKGKLKQSLLRAGASPEKADEVVEEIKAILVEGMSTKKIYKVAFQLLRNTSHAMAARYKLKQAIIELGPTGFPFEQYVAELLKDQGYHVKVGQIVQGHCVSHEIDVIAEKDEQRYMVECKLHVHKGTISDVKIPLYIQSRFLDVESVKKFRQGWVITNTRFSNDAMQYGQCMGLRLVGWDYPQKDSLKDWIDTAGLHPVTSLTTLTLHEKQQLLSMNIVLCKTLRDDDSILESIGVRYPRLSTVMSECRALCESHLEEIN